MEDVARLFRFGEQIKDDRFQVGDKIAMFAICSRGHHSGIGQDGFFAAYGTINVRGAVLVPQGVSLAQAAVATDAVLTAYHAITQRREVKATETVFLFGLGGLGFNALQIVHSAIGARAIILDVRHERLEAAEALGVQKQDIVPPGKSVQEFVGENGLVGQIDTFLDFAEEKQTVEDARSRCRKDCVCWDPLSRQHVKLGVRKRHTILFSYGGQREDLEAVLDLISKKIIVPQVEEARLEDFPRVLDDLCAGKIKARMALMAEL